MRPRFILLTLVGAAILVVATWQVNLNRQSQLVANQVNLMRPSITAALANLGDFQQEPHVTEDLAEAESNLQTAASAFSSGVKLVPGELSRAWARLYLSRTGLTNAVSSLQQVEGLALQSGYQRLPSHYTAYLDSLHEQLDNLQLSLSGQRYTPAQLDQIAVLLERIRSDANGFLNAPTNIP